MRPRTLFLVRSESCSACEIERRPRGARSRRRCSCHDEHLSALTRPNPRPPTPAEFQPHPQAPELISPQRITRHTLALPQPAPRPHKAQHHQRRQRHAVPAQAHRLPAAGTAEHLPAAHITAQADNGMLMRQQNTSGNGPASVGNTGGDNCKGRPPGQRARPYGEPRQYLATQVDRQQQARASPAALEALTWAGHDPG